MSDEGQATCLTRWSMVPGQKDLIRALTSFLFIDSFTSIIYVFFWLLALGGGPQKGSVPCDGLEVDAMTPKKSCGNHGAQTHLNVYC
jgi:hypothetical protein